MSSVYAAVKQAIADVFKGSGAEKLGWYFVFGDRYLRVLDRHDCLIRDWLVDRDDILYDPAAFIRLVRDGLESELCYRASRGPAGKWRKFSTPRAS